MMYLSSAKLIVFSQIDLRRGSMTKPQPVPQVNQRDRLSGEFARAGIRRTNVLAARAHRPIVVRGRKVTISRTDGTTMLHFCFSEWTAQGFSSRKCSQAQCLELGECAFEIACRIPEVQKPGEYDVSALYFWDEKREMPVVRILDFTLQNTYDGDFILGGDHTANIFMIDPAGGDSAESDDEFGSGLFDEQEPRSERVLITA